MERGAGGVTAAGWRRIGALAVAVAVLGAAGGALWLRTDAGARAAPRWLAWAVARDATAQVERVVPAGTRIKVEVLNATDTRGLARTATFVLRDAGFDVVYFGNTGERRDSTLVLDRSGHPDWAALAQGVMQPAAIAARADSGRLVDLTVLVGRRWRPPTEPLRP